MEAVRRTVRAAPDFGIRYLTLYAFSSENWARPPQEVRDLLGLLKLYIRRDLAQLAASGVRIRVIGSRKELQPDIIQLIETAEERTKFNTRLNLNIAFNYGGRDEIARAVECVVAERLGAGGEHATAPVTDACIAKYMDTRDIPDPDLIIRTSGEMRLSNFLLWQAAYSEFVFSACMWPDFDASQMEKALLEYTQRERRYGGLADQPKGAVL